MPADARIHRHSGRGAGAGVGANAAIFSIVDAVLIKPLPFAEPNRLVLVSQVNRQTSAVLALRASRVDPLIALRDD